MAVIGTTAAVTAAGTKIGLDIASVVSKNFKIEEAIKNSPHAEPQVDRIPSPDIILSPLEKTSSVAITRSIDIFNSLRYYYFNIINKYIIFNI